MVSHIGALAIATFVLSLIACLVLLIIFYAVSKKLYPLIYTLSIFTYVNFITYTIDVFDLNKNWIIFLLAISAVIMIFLGVHFSNKEEAEERTIRRK